MPDTVTHIEISALDLAIAEAIVHHGHFYVWPEGAPGCRCLICSTAWATAEAWAKDDGVCPGYVQCGQEPAMLPSQSFAIGPAEGGR